MKLIGTVLRCSSRKVNSSGKESYVTNLTFRACCPRNLMKITVS